MKKLNTNKMFDRAFSNLFLTSMIAIIVCLGALCSTSYAWFELSVSSNGSTIQAAEFSFDVTLTDDSDASEVTPSGINYSLTAGKTYTVLLKKAVGATASQGHCAIGLNGAATTYCTENFESTFTFKLTATTDTTVYFDARIGYSALEDLISIGETVPLS